MSLLAAAVTKLQVRLCMPCQVSSQVLQGLSSRLAASLA